MTGQTTVPQEASHGSGKDLKLSTKKMATQPDAPPAGRPHFTVADIRKAIPEHCFERSALKSFAHLGLVRASPRIFKPSSRARVRFAVMPFFCAPPSRIWPSWLSSVCEASRCCPWSCRWLYGASYGHCIGMRR